MLLILLLQLLLLLSLLLLLLLLIPVCQDSGSRGDTGIQPWYTGTQPGRTANTCSESTSPPYTHPSPLDIGYHQGGAGEGGRRGEGHHSRTGKDSLWTPDTEYCWLLSTGSCHHSRARTWVNRCSCEHVESHSLSDHPGICIIQ